jgi:hypothetical protein
MFGKPTRLNALETRRQLLLVESELNRAQLLNEARDVKHAVHLIREQAHSMGTMAASAAKLATTFFAVRHLFSRRKKSADGKSWVATLLKGAQHCASFLGSRSR